MFKSNGTNFKEIKVFVFLNLKIKYLIKAFIFLKEVTLIENVHQKLCHLSIKNILPPPKKKNLNNFVCKCFSNDCQFKTLETGTVAQSVTRKRKQKPKFVISALVQGWHGLDNHRWKVRLLRKKGKDTSFISDLI